MSDAAKIGGMAHGSPDKKARMRVVASEVRVIAVFIPAAIHNVVSCSGIHGNCWHSLEKG